MAWTYAGDPSVSSLATVRFLIGDTDTTDQLINDAEVTYLITVHGNTNRAASEACRAIAAKFARLMSRSIGGLQADFSAKYSQYLELADNLLAKDEITPVAPFVSGWSRSGKEAIETNDDREPTFGRKGQHDNPRAYPVDESPLGYRRS